MTMLLRRGGGAWREPATDRYEDEADLQRVLADSPSLVPGVGPAVTVAEFPLDGGSVDVVVVEPSGDVTLVECKLAKNPEVRRAVVGQTLSYAARVAKLSVEEFSERFCRRSGGTLHDRMRACIEADPSAGVEWDPQAFDAALAERLARGPLRVVVAVDTVNEELRDIVEFLNLRTTGGLEVLALELVDAACVAQVRRLVDGIVARGARLVPGSGAAPSFFAYGPLGATNRSLFGFTLEESRIGAPSIYFSVESWSRSLTEDELGRLVERLDRSPEMGWLGEAIATRGAKALHRVRIDEVMRGPELVDALLEGLGAFMAPVG
jgi:hypothetical protein